ncbi:hypothetical protein JYK14_03525 [Siccirubricoccus sp. KC 17139]|uniref:Uncharacterized protein n=1 Tax=Siccirubricoccus soli TaxID=2899147 RepID=A0ABT1D002_9PROT|nr:hypothetical protein [Siccirubricoccus soli]MCO6415246.1 hypothetical protein [Siccirubricoccus soli]MCP2681377.1 hypothetical protein [Siccirubricoccus soli]
MQHPFPSRAPALAKPAGEAAELGGLPDRLPWPMAGLVILGLALGAWLAIIFGVARALGLH